MRRLESHDFPGNVRELENIIERAVALSSSQLIGAADLPDVRPSRAVAAADAAAAFPAEGVDLDRLLADYERSWVTRALEHTGGVRKRAATARSASASAQLRYRLVKLGIDKGEPDEPELE